MMSSPSARMVVTPGEPAGIGPDLIIKLVQQAPVAGLVVVANAELLQQRARQLGLPLHVIPYDAGTEAPSQAGTVSVLDIKLAVPVTAGRLDARNAPYVLETLRQAIRICQLHPHAALVTGPIHKGIINEAGAGIRFTGHTEFLAAQTHSPQVVMMLACAGLRVALVTTHLPLAEVSRAISADKLRAVIQVLHHALQRDFGLPRPNILVCGLNPHAGEDGHLGHEEQAIIIPVLDELRQQGIKLQGPLPADTLFIPKYLQQADVVLAMYHDQGLPVLKHMGFGQAVNITLGLPFVRTSVDHGTALELAGTGLADTGSLEAALATARQMLLAQQAMAAQV